MSQSKLILDYVFEHARSLGDNICITQPTGDGKIIAGKWASTRRLESVASRVMGTEFADLNCTAVIFWRCKR